MELNSDETLDYFPFLVLLINDFLDSSVGFGRSDVKLERLSFSDFFNLSVGLRIGILCNKFSQEEKLEGESADNFAEVIRKSENVSDQLIISGQTWVQHKSDGNQSSWDGVEKIVIISFE